MPGNPRFSGRGGSNRGRGRGGRGGGRGGRGGKSRGGRKTYGPRFEGQRTADIEDLEESVSEEEPLSDDDLPSGEESEEDEGTKRQNKPYLALMQSLNKDSKKSLARPNKRKLDAQPGEAQTAKKPKQDEDLENAGDDVDPEGEVEERDVDFVDEPENPEDDDVAAEDDDEDSDEEDLADPFEAHFANPDGAEVKRRIAEVGANKYSPSNTEQNGWRLYRHTLDASSNNKTTKTAIPGPSSLKLKHRLVESAQKQRATFDKLEQFLYPMTFGYQDLLFCGRTPSNAESLRRMACLHAVNHIFKTRDRIIKNNAKLAREGENSQFEPRDQGFTRPKVLMLLPTRQSAVRAVETICGLCEPDQQENRKRFDDTYVDRDSKFSDDRPEDFRELFEGNDDDMFRLGVKFTRKTIKYFAQFYNSDILIASPLGLRMAIGSDDAPDRKHRRKDDGLDYDFLSSIEVVIVDQADALLMQNWEHVEYIFEHLNLQPREAHGCDFGRVREWYLEKQASHFRQTLVFSAYHTPELAELQRRHQLNWSGRARIQQPYEGVIQHLGVRGTRQTFSRFEAPSLPQEPDARFAYLTSAVMPWLTKRAKAYSKISDDVEGGGAKGTLIFIPSYLDFVRVRNYFATSSSLTFGAVSEYTSVPEASRARSHFQNGRHQVLLYTGRAHHFRRHLNLRGVGAVVCYSPPENPIFYREICGGYLGLAERDLRLSPGEGVVRVLFSRYDVLALERIVGTARVGKMLREKGDTFDFV